MHIKMSKSEPIPVVLNRIFWNGPDKKTQQNIFRNRKTGQKLLKKKKMLVSASRSVSRNVLRAISTNNAKLEEVTLTKNRDYYDNNFKVQEEYGKPADWDTAKPFHTIPGPKPLPIIGNVWRFFPVVGELYKMDFVDMHKKFYKDYGEIVLFGGIGRQMVIIFNPDYIETLHRNEGPWPIRIGLPSITYYRNELRHDVFKGNGGLLTIQGKTWFDSRSKVNPSVLQPRMVAKYTPHVDEVAGDLVTRMKDLAKTDEKGEMPENFFNELLTWSLEGIAIIALDHHFGFLKLNEKPDPEAQLLIDSVLAMNELTVELDIKPSIWKYVSTPAWRRYVKAMDNTTDITYKYLKQSLKKIENKNIPDSELSAIQIVSKRDMQLAVATAMDLIVGGIDTTSRTLGAVLYFLAKNKNVQDKLREELKKLLPTRDAPVTQDVLLEASYLRAAIKETMRIAGAAIGTVRTTVKDMVIGGYQIPKGTEIITSNLILSNDDKYFPRAKEFLPERWLRTTTGELSYKNTHPFVYLPFGFGPRSCLGKRLANLELEVATAKIIRNLELSWDREDMTFRMVLLYGINDPLRLKVKSIEN